MVVTSLVEIKHSTLNQLNRLGLQSSKVVQEISKVIVFTHLRKTLCPWSVLSVSYYFYHGRSLCAEKIRRNWVVKERGSKFA